MDCPKRKAKYKTDEQRKNAKAEQKKTYDKARIYIGSSIEEWDKQKNVCGGGHTDFALHLLNLHRAYCTNFLGVQSSMHEKSKITSTNDSTACQHEKCLLFQ